ncbi:MAG TPA: Do family serine endopeptidase [Acidobacteriaceae bacterium]|nr:Do family serine endopeptidase [Acidobacteriaceae bacterium]
MKLGKLKQLAVPAVAAGALVGMGVWEFARPAVAAMAPPPAASVQDNNTLMELDRAMENLAGRITPAVVNVNVTSKMTQHQIASEEGAQNQDQDQEQQQQQMQQFFGQNSPFGQFFQMPMRPRGPEIEKGQGSGVILSPDGYIVTNNHVVKGAIDINVTLSNRDVYKAKLIGTDPLTDLAVIKINATNLPSVSWGDSSQLHPGQNVLAFGNPYGFRFTVTRGIISALNRPNPEADRHKPGEFIQTDAAINPGNSGGALVDARGQLIGINTFLISPTGSFSGMGFAIPSEVAQPVVEKLIKSGKIEHGVMGVTISDVTPSNAHFFHMNKAEGAVVTEVNAGSPGDKAGLKTGDVITGINGQQITDSGQLQMLVLQNAPGTTIHLEVARDGKTMTVPVTLGSMNDNGNEVLAANHSGKGRWGLGLADLTPDVRNQIQASRNVEGAVVESVRPGSPADEAGLQQGDVIVSVNRKPTHNAQEVAQALSSVPEGQDALVLVWSNGGNTFRVLHPSQG